MNRPIEIVPAIKRLKLRQVGCWEHLNLEFLPGLNIITEEGSTDGKSTIFRAILYSLNPTSHLECGLTPTFGAEQGSISVEFMSAFQSTRLRLPRHESEDEHLEFRGESMSRRLSALLATATPTMALLIEDDVTGILDANTYSQVVTLLNSSRCQVICQIAHRLAVKNYPEARIYACSMEKQGKVSMKLQQVGTYDKHATGKSIPSQGIFI